MRRLYKNVSVVADQDRYTVSLDDRLLNTPDKFLLSIATQALAEAIAEEWRAQEIFIVPATMPLTQLANTAMDRIAHRRDEVIKDLMEYATTDLVCYRASEPDELVAAQAALFDPLLEWFENRTDCALVVARGIMLVEQPPRTLTAVYTWLECKSLEILTALQAATALASSLLIALALIEGELGANEAYEAACCDELYQIKKWGEDDEARERLDAVRQEFETLERFIGLLAG